MVNTESNKLIVGIKGGVKSKGILWTKRAKVVRVGITLGARPRKGSLWQ